MRRRLDNRLVDEAVDAYVDWREECVAVHDAYDRWTNAPYPDAGSASAAYHAALDREQRAAEIYAAVVRRIAARAVPTRMPVAPAVLALQW